MATVRLQIRRGTASQWTSANPILAAGEMGVETDSRKIKIGDGATSWTSLSYIAADNPEISEIAQDAIDAALVAGTGIVKSYNDGTNTITVSVDTSVIATKAELAEVAQDSIDQALTAGTGITKNYDDTANTLTVSVDTNVISTVQYVDDEITNLGNNLNNTIGDYIPLSEKGTLGGVATLDANTLVPLSQLTNATDYADNVALNAQVAAISAASDDLSNHNGDQTNVHGIADTSILVTTTGNQTLTNKTLTSPLGIVKADVGLGNVDNSSDLNKPISTATQGALDLKAPLASPTFTGAPSAPTAPLGNSTTQIATTEFVGTALSNLISGAPEALNTLNELAAAINDDENYAATVTTYLTALDNNKVNETAFEAHRVDTTDVHGIINTADIVYTSDSRLSDNRTPVNGSVTSEKIANDAVSTTHITDLNVTTAKIADTAVTTAKIADTAVTTAKIADAAVTTDKVDDVAITSAKIADNAVGSDHLAVNSIVESKIANSSVTTDKIADTAVTTAKIADTAVTTAKIADAAVTSAKIADASVGTDHISASAINTSKILDDNITTAKIADAAVTTAKIADEAVTTAKISDLNVTTAKIANSSVTTDKIESLSITEGKIADGAVTSAKIANGTIVNTDINASAEIDQSKIANLISDLDLKAPLASPTFTGTVAGITKSMVGLGNVDNTSDTDKPISTATQSALNLKSPLADPTFTGTVTLPNTTSVGNVSSTEIAYLDGVTSAIQTQLDTKALDSDLDAHTGATTSVHGISNTAQLAYLNAANQTFTGNMEVDGDMTVDGNLTVNGTTFNASATSITIEDNMVQLAHQNAANTVDLGLVVAYNDGTAKHSGIVRDVSANKWKIFKGVTTEPSTTVDFTEGSLDDLEVAGLTANSLTVGSVSNTEIGYLDGVTSPIQTQLDAKLASSTASSTYAPIASPTFTGTVTVAASGVAFTDGTQTKAAVPSLTTIASATTGAYNLSTGGLTLRDQLIPIGGTHTITVPTNTTTAYPVGTSISFYQSAGTGGNFVGADVSVSILATPGATLRTTYSSATLTKVATNTWLLAGDLKA